MRHMSDDHTHVQEFFARPRGRLGQPVPRRRPRLRRRGRRARAARGRPGARRGLRHRAGPAAAACGRGALGSGRRGRSDPGHAGGRRTGRAGTATGTCCSPTSPRCRCAPQSLDAVFGAGLICHLPASGGESAGVGARGAPRRRCWPCSIPIGRAALAARQGRQITPDDLRAEPNLRPLLAGSGWRMTSYVDEDARFLALAVRAG